MIGENTLSFGVVFLILPVGEEAREEVTKHEQSKARLLDAKETTQGKPFESVAIQAQKETPPKKEYQESYTANFTNFCRPIGPLNPFKRRKNLLLSATPGFWCVEIVEQMDPQRYGVQTERCP